MGSLPRAKSYVYEINTLELKDQDFPLGEWYSCRGLALVANSGTSTLRFKWGKNLGSDTKMLPLIKSDYLFGLIAINMEGWFHSSVKLPPLLFTLRKRNAARKHNN